MLAFVWLMSGVVLKARRGRVALLKLSRNKKRVVAISREALLECGASSHHFFLRLQPIDEPDHPLHEIAEIRYQIGAEAFKRDLSGCENQHDA